MWRALIPMLGFLVLVPALDAQESKDPPKEKASEATQQLQEIMSELGKAQGEIIKKFNSAETDEEKGKLRKEYFALPGKYASRLLEVAEKHPKDPAATQALRFILERVEAGDAAAEKDLKATLKNSKQKDVQAVTSYVLAKVIVSLAGEDQKRQAEAEKLFERVTKEFGDVMLGRSSLADMAQDDLFLLKNLSLGKVAPEIEAEDIDGVKFKLSDYRGKVVVLDFWGHWWPPCRAMYAHERSLVKRLAGKPFALLGINSDRDREKLKETLKKEKITWRSWWNGPKGTSGPISEEWRVTAWPTIYVLDAEGKIRYKNVRGEAMDKAVDELLAELEEKQKK